MAPKSRSHSFDNSTTIELIREPTEWIQNNYEKFRSGLLVADFVESADQALQNLRTQAEEMILPFRMNFNQPSRFQFLDVMGEGGWRNRKRGTRLSATQRAVSFGNLLQQPKSARIGQRFE
jgi:hypothetical protein